MAEPLYVYIHIPKTGGTTFRWHVYNNYQEGEEVIDATGQRMDLVAKQVTDKTKFIIGHMAYGIHWFLEGRREVRYMTLVRDAYDRFLSNFFFLKREETHHLQKIVKDMDIDEYIDECSQKYPTCRPWLQMEYLFGQRLSDPRILTEGDVRPLDVVIDNLKEKFETVGTTDKYPEYLKELQTKGILPIIKDIDFKAAVADNKTELTDEQIKRVVQLVEPDQQLYRYVKFAYWS